MSNKTDSFGTSYSLNKVNEKNPIVFIHGVGLTKEIWEPQINFFKDYNTLRYDLLGHGKTPIKKSNPSGSANSSCRKVPTVLPVIRLSISPHKKP